MTNDDIENAGVAEMIANGVPTTKALRLYARLSLEQMSQLSGIFRMRLVAIEQGSEPSLDEVRRISAALEQARLWKHS